MIKNNILIVDDDQIILDSLCEFLSLEGFQTDGAETFKSALAKLNEQNYRLVITDVHLPDGNGLELLDIIRRICSKPSFPGMIIAHYQPEPVHGDL